VKVRYAIGGIAAAALLALPAGAAASQGGQAQQPGRAAVRAGAGGHRQEGLSQALRRQARDAGLLEEGQGQAVAVLGTASSDCQTELAEIGVADFIDEFGADATDTLENAMAECVAEDTAQILDPGDYGEDDGSDA